MSEQDEHPTRGRAWSRPVSWTSRPTDQPPIGHTAPEVPPTEVPPPGACPGRQPAQPTGAQPLAGRPAGRGLDPDPPGDPSPGQPPYGQAPYPGQANAGQPPYGGQGVPPGYGGRPNGANGRIFGLTCWCSC